MSQRGLNQGKRRVATMIHTNQTIAGNPGADDRLGIRRLDDENREYAGTGGVSRNNRSYGFVPGSSARVPRRRRETPDSDRPTIPDSSRALTASRSAARRTAFVTTAPAAGNPLICKASGPDWPSRREPLDSQHVCSLQ